MINLQLTESYKNYYAILDEDEDISNDNIDERDDSNIIVTQANHINGWEDSFYIRNIEVPQYETTNLIDLISKEQWGLILERLQTEDGYQEAQKLYGFVTEECIYTYQFPIHFACRKRNVPLKVIQTLLDAYPEGISKVDDVDELPLHCAAESGTSIDIIVLLINANSNSIKHQNKFGDLPIHIAIFNSSVETGTSIDIINLLIKEDSDSLKHRNNYGELPIHFAASSNSVKKFQVILDVREALTAYPEGAKSKDNEGCLPIHVACQKSSAVDVVQVLFEAYPFGVKAKNYDENLPIHMACTPITLDEFNEVQFDEFNNEVIKFLIKQYPDGARQYNKNGSLPFHLACIYAGRRNNIELLQILLDAYPDSIILTRRSNLNPMRYEHPIEIVGPHPAILSYLNNAEQDYYINLAHKMLYQLQEEG